MTNKHKDIAAHLGAITQSFADRLNNEQSGVWDSLFNNHIDPEFKATPAPPGPSEPLPLKEYMAWSQKLLAEQPGLRREFVDTAIYIDEEAQHGDVLVNYRIHGAPEGIVYAAIAIFRYRVRSDDGVKKWVLFTLDLADGLGGR